MSFYFPRQEIYITVPYKNGATSALNFFVRVEKNLESKGAHLSEIDSLEELIINDDLGVHSKSGQYSAEPFRALANKTNHDMAEIRFLIIRDPYKRFSSFWHDRIMNGPDPYFRKIHTRLSSKYDLNDSLDTQRAAVGFLNGLARPLTRTITNGHLRPQIYLAKGKRYDFIIETDELDNLTKTLQNRSSNFRSFKDLSVPRLNISANCDRLIVWNDDMKSAFEKTYKSDLELYFGYSSSQSSDNLLINRVQKNLTPYDHFLIYARNPVKKLFGR